MPAVSDSLLRFPILRINDAHIRKFNTSNDLRRMTQRHFDEGGFKRNALLIDSSGKQFPIRDVRRVSRSWHPAYWFAPSPALVVEVLVGEPVQLSLDQIKTSIIEVVCKNHWYKQGDETEAEFRTAFEKLQSIAEVMQNISFYGKWQG